MIYSRMAREGTTLSIGATKTLEHPSMDFRPWTTYQVGILYMMDSYVIFIQIELLCPMGTRYEAPQCREERVNGTRMVSEWLAHRRERQTEGTRHLGSVCNVDVEDERLEGLTPGG